jgi:hypothetical protein
MRWVRGREKFRVVNLCYAEASIDLAGIAFQNALWCIHAVILGSE